MTVRVPYTRVGHTVMTGTLRYHRVVRIDSPRSVRFHRRCPRVIGLTLLALCMGGAVVSAAPNDPRSIVLFEQTCTSDRGRRVVTLFANGTVRLKETTRAMGGDRLWDVDREDHSQLYVIELSPEETATYREQLDVENPGDGFLPEREGGDLVGIGVESCELTYRQASGATKRYVFSPVEVPSLRLERYVTLASDLARRAVPEEVPETLDEAYVPRMGDVLRDLSGVRYRITWISVEGLVELDGIDQPIHVRIGLPDLGTRFVARVEP